MRLAGDEFGQTQQGNNNVYCQDNATAWLDWSLPDGDRGAALIAFVSRLIALRREQPLLQGLYFQHAQLELAPGVRDVFWFDENGDDLPEDHWNNPNARLLGLRRAAPMADDDGKTIEAVIAPIGRASCRERVCQYV